jgi:radical SAM protein with 4Fe4S-binding SPASM domain
VKGRNTSPHLFLNPSVYFGVDHGVPVLRQGAHGITHKLQLGEAIALTFLNASGQRDEAAVLCSAEIVNGERWVDRVIDRYWSYFGGTSGESPDFGWLKQTNFDALEDDNAGRKRVAPQSLVWLVTLGCNRKCPYCYYKVFPHAINERHDPLDATFPKAAILGVLAEMRDIGASNLYLTGGEPLLRSDIIEILNEARLKRIRTHLSTKYPIDQSLAHQLKAAGVQSITYSLDAGERRIADGLAGNKGFFDQAVSALKAMLRVGLDPEVNTVITRLNVNKLDELAHLLVEIGVRRLAVSLFIQPPRNPSGVTNLFPIQDDDEVAALIGDLQLRWEGKLEIRLGDSAKNQGQTVDQNQPVCEVGYTELHLLPDGQATRCRYLPNETGLHLGSLKDLNIMEIWHGSKLNDLNSPSYKIYEGTECSSCDLFNSCNRRGRCFVSALQKTGSLTAPDVFCQQESIQ